MIASALDVGLSLMNRSVNKPWGGGGKQPTLELSIEADIHEVELMLSKVEREVVPRATVAALNKTARRIRTDGIRQVAAETGVRPQSLIRDRYRLKQATLTRQAILISILVKPVAAARLGSTKKNAIGARQNAHGVTAGNRSYPHAFLADPPGKGGGTHVFYRVGKKRYPIDVHHVEIEAVARAINDRLVASTGRALFKGFMEHELKWRLERVSR